MAEYILPPDLNLQWASSGDILKPSDTKVQQGWAPEIPPRQWFNWLDNRQDQAIAHIAQHGITVWSSAIEYQAGKSYVQGSDGFIYKALTTHTNINPVGGAAGNWESAFITASTATQVATAAQSRALTANNVYLSPLQLANAFTGTNQQIASNGYQTLPGGLILQWGNSSSTTTEAVVTFPKAFTSSVLFVGTHDRISTASTSQRSIFNVGSVTLTGFTATNIGILLRGTGTLQPPGNNACPWFAIGV